MKHLTFSILLSLVSFISYGQEFRKVKVNFGFGQGSGLENYHQRGSVSTALIYLEPSYRLKDNLSIGIRFEGSLDPSKNMGNYGIIGQYYFSNKAFRPFAGLGVGMYHASIGQGAYYGYGSRNEETTFGLYPRLGFDYGHLSFLIDLNLVSKAKATVNSPVDQGGQVYTDYLNYNYLSVKAGVFFGGGRKKSK